MRHMIIATASVMVLLAGCAGGMNDQSSTGSTGMSGSTAATSGSTGMSGSTASGSGTHNAAGGTASNVDEVGGDRTANWPAERGQGLSPTRESAISGQGAASSNTNTGPYPRQGQTQALNRQASPDERGQGLSPTRQSLPNTAGTQ